MSTDRLRRAPRGMSLIEVMTAMAILGIATLGLVGGVIVALSANAISARRTQMKEFAQSRVERLTAMRSSQIPNSSTTFPANFSGMGTGGPAFNPLSPPGTGGWMLDVIDAGTATSGFDAMAGPTLVDDSSAGSADYTAPTVVVSTLPAKTIAHRAAMITKWNGDSTTSCADSTVTADTSVLCREIHIEQQTSPSGAPLWHAWVRVVQGGPNWQTSNLTLDQVMAR